MTKPLEPELIRKLLDYDPDTGALTWKPRTPDMFEDEAHSAEHNCAKWNARYSGRETGTPYTGGYLAVGFGGRRFLAHRVAWAFVNGEWPKAQIDHIDGNRANNRIKNLRGADHSSNGANRVAPATNKSGAKGVSWSKKERKWIAHIRVKNRSLRLGGFHSVEEAASAYAEASRKHFGEFSRV